MTISDAKMKRVTATGDLAVGPARIRGLHVLAATGGVARVTITDGAGGSTIVDMDFDAGDSHTTTFPAMGIRAQNTAVVTTMTNVTALTVFYT